MGKTNFYKINNVEKLAIYNAIANVSGLSAFAVEKDWWVTQTLEIIFKLKISEHLVFKGGTSLSKAWKLIDRFSEDIDLALDKDFFPDYQGELSRTKIGKLRRVAGNYITNILIKQLEDAFKASAITEVTFNLIKTGEGDQDPSIIEISYPNIIPQPGAYILPRILLEISCRSLREPFTSQEISSLVDAHFPESDFASLPITIPTATAERTFLEKLFLLHEEFQRPTEKMRVNRLSRHMYDIFQLTRYGIAGKAIYDKYLYQSIVAHRYKFSRIGDINYQLHSPDKINLIPPESIIPDWEKDYKSMLNEMIFGFPKPSFKDLIQNLRELTVEMKSLPWQFDLQFPDNRF